MKYKELVAATANKLYHEIVSNMSGVDSFKSFIVSKKMNSDQVKSAIVFAADSVLYEERNNYIRANKHLTGYDSCTMTLEGCVISESENIESRYREFKDYVIKDLDKLFK